MTDSFLPFQHLIDPDRALRILRGATDGADDGELFLERTRSESLVFDDRRLRNAGYGAAQGFGLRAVRGEVTGYAHSTRIAEDALRDAAALPEVACTVWSNLVDVARLAPGETVLVHGGTSGIGTFAIQLAKARGCRVAVTAGTPEKLAFCRELGADVAVNYREDDFVEAVREATDGRGADVVLDSIGAKYLSRNVDVLATGGRLVVIGLLGGRKGELDLAALLGKRGSITATSLRARDADDKARIVAAVRDEVWPLLADGSVRPVVHSTHPLAEAAAAHREMESSTHVGKILLLP